MALFFNVVGWHCCLSLCILGFVNFLSWKIWNSTQFTWYKVESFSLRITKCLYTDANNFDKSIWIGRGRGGGRRYNCYLSGPYAFTLYFIPHLTYCHHLWNFCKSSDSRKIERVQERALRAIYKSKTETYEELLARARLPTLYNRRLQDIATLMYKVG